MACAMPNRHPEMSSKALHAWANWTVNTLVMAMLLGSKNTAAGWHGAWHIVADMMWCTSLSDGTSNWFALFCRSLKKTK